MIDFATFKTLNNQFTVNSVTAIRRLVIDGAGIHLGPRWFFEEAIQQGQVILLFIAYISDAGLSYAIRSY